MSSVMNDWLFACEMRSNASKVLNTSIACKSGRSLGREICVVTVNILHQTLISSFNFMFHYSTTTLWETSQTKLHLSMQEPTESAAYRHASLSTRLRLARSTNSLQGLRVLPSQSVKWIRFWCECPLLSLPSKFCHSSVRLSWELNVCVLGTHWHSSLIWTSVEEIYRCATVIHQQRCSITKQEAGVYIGHAQYFIWKAGQP